MRRFGRRRFLSGAGALAAASAGAGRAEPARAQPAPPPFSWGVGSFDPTPASVLLWTRVDPGGGGGAPVTLQWVLARDEALTDVAAEGTVVAAADTDHCATVEVSGLDDGRRWWYGFTAPDGTRSPVGRTRTLPRHGDRLRLAAVACARYADGGFAAYRAIAARDVDLVLHLGDYIYEDGGTGERRHEPPRRLTTLADYRARYAQHRSDPDLQALHAAHPMVATWDDHDVAGNAWRDGARAHDDDRDGPWAERVRAATQAHAEWLPGRTARGADGRLRAWRAIDLGGLAELVVLDTRLWGRDRPPSTPEEVPATDRSMLGPDQAAFVAERLRRAERPPWVLLANQVMLHPLELPVPSASLTEQLLDGGYLVSDGSAINPDQWDGYPAARDDLLAAVGTRGGVVVLTGDVHSSWAWEGPAQSDGDPVMVELVTSSVSSATFAERIPVPVGLVELGLRTLEDDLSHVELSNHGFVLVDLGPDRVVGEWWHIDPSVPGSERFHTARSAPVDPPMRLTEVDGPMADRTEAELAAPSAGPVPSGPGGDDEPPWPAIGLGTAAATAAVAAAVAVRRRTTR